MWSVLKIAMGHLYRTLRIVCLLIGLMVGGAGLVYAVSPVIDVKGIAETGKLLSAMLEQLGVLKDMRNKAQDTIDTIGEYTQIPVTVLNLDKIQRQLKRDLECLTPDYSKLFPALVETEYNWTSICYGARGYRDVLFVQPDDEEFKERTLEQQREIYEEIDALRLNLIIDTALKATSQGDVGVEGAKELNEAASELSKALETSKTLNARIALVVEGQIAQIRGIAQTNMLLAQGLKLEGAKTIRNDGGLTLPELEE